jgi:hypothetical protein
MLTGVFELPQPLDWLVSAFIPSLLLLVLVGYIFVMIFAAGMKAGHKHAVEECYTRRGHKFSCNHSW